MSLGMAMQLPKLFRSGLGGSGGRYPRILQENLGGILTEGGDFLAQEGVDNPTIVDLPCVLWLTGKEAYAVRATDGDSVAPLKNIAPNRSELLVMPNQLHPPYATYASSSYFGWSIHCEYEQGWLTEDKQLLFSPTLSYPGWTDGENSVISGTAHFAVVTLDFIDTQDIGYVGVFGLSQEFNETLGYDELVITVLDEIVNQQVVATIKWAELPVNTPLPSRALLEYRLVDEGGQTYFQKIYCNGQLLASTEVTSIPPNPPVLNRQLTSLGKGVYTFSGAFIGEIYEVRIYSASLDDADYLSVRRELSTNYLLPTSNIL